MSRKRRRERVSANPVEFANPRLLSKLVTPSIPAPGRLSKKQNLQVIDDRRSHHPLGFFRPAKTITGHSVKPNVVGRQTRTKTLPSTVAFAVPKQTLICVRREQRKEVLFAKKKTRKGSRSKKFRNWYSAISCKR